MLVLGSGSFTFGFSLRLTAEIRARKLTHDNKVAPDAASLADDVAASVQRSKVSGHPLRRRLHLFFYHNFYVAIACEAGGIHVLTNKLLKIAHVTS
jgi:hypothetical protein